MLSPRFWFGSVVVAAACWPNPLHAVSVEDIVSHVSQAQYTEYLSADDFLYTHLGDNREWGAEHDLARDNIFSTLDSFGLETSLEPFSYGGGTYHNVVGLHRGKVTPEIVYLVGAHFDSSNSRGGGSDDSAPGADDNASGVAGILEAARVLSQFDFKSSLAFVAFDREEQGLIGSTTYAAEHVLDDIRGMISMDMIGFNHLDPVHHDKAWVYYSEANEACLEVAQGLADSLQTHGDILADLAQMGSSDHVPFSDDGSCLLIEHAMSRGDYDNPHYHRYTDAVESTYSYNGETLPYLDYEYATNMTRGTVGYLALQAAPVPEPASVMLLLSAAVALWLVRRRVRS